VVPRDLSGSLTEITIAEINYRRIAQSSEEWRWGTASKRRFDSAEETMANCSRSTAGANLLIMDDDRATAHIFAQCSV